MTKWTWVAAMSVLLSIAPALEAAAQAPPAPVLVAPANGAALVQPIILDWGAVVDPDGPIGSYTWQVSSTSTPPTSAPPSSGVGISSRSSMPWNRAQAPRRHRHRPSAWCPESSA